MCTANEEIQHLALLSCLLSPAKLGMINWSRVAVILIGACCSCACTLSSFCEVLNHITLKELVNCLSRCGIVTSSLFGCCAYWQALIRDVIWHSLQWVLWPSCLGTLWVFGCTGFFYVQVSLLLSSLLLMSTDFSKRVGRIFLKM